MTTRLRFISLARRGVPLARGVAAAQTGPRPVETIPGMPPVVNPTNLYSEIRPDKLSPTVSGALPRVYVPNRQVNDVYVIDPATHEGRRPVPGRREPAARRARRGT